MLADTVAAALDRLAQPPDQADRYFPDARPTQQPPTTLLWLVWLILAGRGFGKTRTGAEWLTDRALEAPGTRWALVAPTFADARDTCIEGESGVLAVLDRRGQHTRTWNRSLGELILPNSSRIKLFSGDEPDRLRGPQHHGAWVDELAAFRYPEAWDQLLFGLRLGEHPQTVVTTTPRPTSLIRELLADVDHNAVTRGSTFDNADNLAPSMLAKLRDRYEGTRLGRQELHAEVLDEVEGALWTSEALDAGRCRFEPDAWPTLVEVAVAVDPAVTSGEDADESGIVAAAVGEVGWCPVCGALSEGDRHVFVLADESGRYDPVATMSQAIGLYGDLQADAVVVERNNGGDYLPAVARNVDPSVTVETVVATRGKALRAQPIAALYEQGRVHHVGSFPDLETQMTTWTPDASWSPDRLDALVWAITWLWRRRTSRWAPADLT